NPRGAEDVFAHALSLSANVFGITNADIAGNLVLRRPRPGVPMYYLLATTLMLAAVRRRRPLRLLVLVLVVAAIAVTVTLAVQRSRARRALQNRPPPRTTHEKPPDDV